MSDCYWRSLLFVPGNRPGRWESALDSGADAVCVDLEDAVKEADKPAARQELYATLKNFNRERVSVIVRVNGSGTDWHDEDVQGLESLHQTVGVMLPKASLDGLQQLLSRVQNRKVIALLEDADAIEDAYRLAQLDGVSGLMIGGADLSMQLGAKLGWDTLLYARSRLLMAAASANRMAIDVPCLNLKDAEVVFQETDRVAALGFSCKAAVHPAQIEPIHRALTPDEDEVVQARAMLEAFASAVGDAVEYNGIMLDAPVLANARRVLARTGEV